MPRLTAYVDGFNLYYGLRSKGWRSYYWLNIHRLVENLLKPDQRLVAVHYFTAHIAAKRGNHDKRRRQQTFLEALATLPDVRLHYGRYLVKSRHCSQCGTTWETFEEKMTDVNIAVELLGDAQDDAFDTAIVVSGGQRSDATGAGSPGALSGQARRRGFPAQSDVRAITRGRDSSVCDRPQNTQGQSVARSNRQERRSRP